MPADREYRASSKKHFATRTPGALLAADKTVCVSVRVRPGSTWILGGGATFSLKSPIDSRNLITGKRTSNEITGCNFAGAPNTVVKNRTSIWTAALTLLAAVAILQGVFDRRREIAEQLRAQQGQQQAQQKATAARAKLDSDEKALANACDGLRGKVSPSFAEIEQSCVKPLAEGGNTTAQREIGSVLEAESEYSSAIAWYERAAGQGDTKAMYSLALLHSVGDSHKHVEKRYDPLVDPGRQFTGIHVPPI